MKTQPKDLNILEDRIVTFGIFILIYESFITDLEEKIEETYTSIETVINGKLIPANVSTVYINNLNKKWPDNKNNRDKLRSLFNLAIKDTLITEYRDTDFKKIRDLRHKYVHEFKEMLNRPKMTHEELETLKLLLDLYSHFIHNYFVKYECLFLELNPMDYKDTHIMTPIINICLQILRRRFKFPK